MKTLLSFSLIVLAGHLLMWPASAQERGIGLNAPSASHYYALIIGNNDYQKIRRLQTAETDAREMERMLKTQYGFQTKLLLNATRQQILSALNSYRRILDAEANLLIYYAGHGVNDKEADKAYWLPVDAELDDNANWISADDITTNIKVIPARHVLIVSDSCYSGTLTRGLGDVLPRPTEREQFLRKMSAGKSRTLMASGGDEPVADGGGGSHSVFANALLRGLREMDKGQFTAAELFRYHVEEAVGGRANQTPEYNPLRNSGHENGDFIFVRSRAGDNNASTTVRAPAAGATDTNTATAVELSYWNSIQNSADPEDFKDYLLKYPDGQFASIARRRAARAHDPGTSTREDRTEKGTAQPSKTAATENSGLVLFVELLTTLDTSTTLAGDRFTGRVVAPHQYEGATLEGQITKVSRGGRVSGNSEIGLRLERIRFRDGRTYNLSAELLEVERGNVTGTDVRVKNDAPGRETTNKSPGAVGAGLGAIIGAIAGEGKGAAIGAAVGDARENVIISSGQDFRMAQGARFQVLMLKYE